MARSRRRAIRACSADGATVIAATLADPQAVTPALQEADEAGARIITFNSGAEFAHEAGSELHISIDDHATGRLAGERFNAAEVDGEIVCLIHEDVNTGLDERCDGLAETYAGGDVRPLHIPDDYDREQTTQFAIDLLRGEGAPAGILALNVDTTLAVMEALSRVRSELDYRPIVGSIGGHPDISRLPLDLRNDHLAFLTNDLGPAQGYLNHGGAANGAGVPCAGALRDGYLDPQGRAVRDQQRRGPRGRQRRRPARPGRGVGPARRRRRTGSSALSDEVNLPAGSNAPLLRGLPPILPEGRMRGAGAGLVPERRLTGRRGSTTRTRRTGSGECWSTAEQLRTRVRRTRSACGAYGGSAWACGTSTARCGARVRAMIGFGTRRRTGWICCCATEGRFRFC